MKPYEVVFSSLKLTDEDIFRELGYGKTTPESYVVEEVAGLMEYLACHIKPGCAFAIYDGEAIRDSIYLNDIQLNTGKVIAPLMKHSTAFAVFAVTAGQEFEAYTHQLKQEGDILRSFLLDTIGTCIAERAGDYMENRLEEQIGGLNHTNRFSPGYCGWHLTEQKKIFHLLGDTPCGIQLSEVCLMTPIKSISGIIGVGERVARKQYGCNICDFEDCYKRRLKNELL